MSCPRSRCRLHRCLQMTDGCCNSLRHRVCDALCGALRRCVSLFWHPRPVPRRSARPRTVIIAVSQLLNAHSSGCDLKTMGSDIEGGPPPPADPPSRCAPTYPKNGCVSRSGHVASCPGEYQSQTVFAVDLCHGFVGIINSSYAVFH